MPPELGGRLPALWTKLGVIRLPQEQQERAERLVQELEAIFEDASKKAS